PGLRPRVFGDTHAGRARAADTILNQLEGDLVAYGQLVERAERRVAAVKEHLATLRVTDESVALAGVDANDPAARRPPGRRLRLVGFTRTGGRLGALCSCTIM